MPRQRTARDTSRQGRGRNRRVSIRSELRREPDLKKIAGTVIALAMAQAEKEAQARDDGARPKAESVDD